jgi:hypothetical protein
MKTMPYVLNCAELRPHSIHSKLVISHLLGITKRQNLGSRLWSPPGQKKYNMHSGETLCLAVAQPALLSRSRRAFKWYASRDTEVCWGICHHQHSTVTAAQEKPAHSPRLNTSSEEMLFLHSPSQNPKVPRSALKPKEIIKRMQKVCGGGRGDALMKMTHLFHTFLQHFFT